MRKVKYLIKANHSNPVMVIVLILMLCSGIDCSNSLDSDSNSNREISKPNFLVIMVDDLGYNHTGYQNEIYNTPNINKLRDQGMLFSDAYIASPTCSPSRATLVTGKHPARLGIVRHIPVRPAEGSTGDEIEEFHTWPTDPAQMPSRNWLPLEETTYAEELKRVGYYNVFVGKWHLGHAPYFPVKNGFDEEWGTSDLGHPFSYYPPSFISPKVAERDSTGRYLTDLLTDYTVNFIESYDKEKPFSLSLFYYSVHTPYQGRGDLVDYYLLKGLTGREAHHAAMISAVDESIGRIRNALSEKDLDKNTAIIFLGDQGGLISNAPLRGGKKGGEALYEGGAKVPFIVCYPGVSKANSLCTYPISSTDIFPTLIDLAGGDPGSTDDLDGLSILPLIKGESTLERPAIYMYRSYEDQYAAVRYKNYKLIAYRSGKRELYNLETDPHENSDISINNSGLVNLISDMLHSWEDKMGVSGY